MFNKKYLFVVAFLFILDKAHGAEGGYFDTQNGSEYLGFANMNKEFQITSLMNSAIANDSKATKIFIASGADVNDTNIAKVSALHLAARNYAYESAQVLIENGANVNAKDLEGWTPLMRASLNGDEKIVQLLVGSGAGIWTQNVYGDSALVHAAMSDCYECGKVLLENSNAPRAFVKEQVSRALNITKKRYNEPFIELLTGYISGGETLVLSTEKTPSLNSDVNDASTNESITRIIYKFLGKTINTSELSEINRNFKLSQKDTSQNKQKANKHSSDPEERKMIKSFSFSGKRKSPAVLENDLDKNAEVVKDSKSVEENKVVKDNIVLKDSKISAKDQITEVSKKKFDLKEGKKPVVQSQTFENISDTKFNLQKNKQTDLSADKISNEEQINEASEKKFNFKEGKKPVVQSQPIDNVNDKKFSFKEGQRPAVQNQSIESVSDEQLNLEDDKQVDLESKSYRLNSVKREVQPEKSGNVMPEDAENNRSYKLNSTKQNTVPVSDEEEFEKIYSLQSDNNTLN